MPFLPPNQQCQRLAHSDKGEDARILLNGVTCTVSVPYAVQNWSKKWLHNPSIKKVVMKYMLMLPIVTHQVVWSVGLSVTLVSCAKPVEPIKMPFGLWAVMGPRNRVSLRSRSPMRWGYYRGRGARCKKSIKQLKRTICHFGCGFWWAEGSTSLIVLAMWRQSVVMYVGTLALPGEYDLNVRLR